MITAFIGTTELLLIGGLALLLVGGKKLPEMMRGLGKGVREFKDGMKEGATDDAASAVNATECAKERTADGDAENRSDAKE